jgi:hypothetical protein
MDRAYPGLLIEGAHPAFRVERLSRQRPDEQSADQSTEVR